MRYRALDANGDYSFGNGPVDFLVNSPQCVAQAVQTRLMLFLGEWFLDTTDGTPWNTQILGKYTGTGYDMVIKERILDTPGVQAITAYSSTADRAARALSIQANVSTIYGAAVVQVTL